MPIVISYDDFDTVCYSNQHNIIELIKHSIGFSVDININAGNIANLNTRVDQVEQTSQEGHDAWLLAQSLNERMSATEFWVTAIKDMNEYFGACNLGKEIAQITKRLNDAGI